MCSLDGNLDNVRPIAEFSPSVWGYHFLNSSPFLNGQQPEIQQRSQNLKEKVGRLLLEKAEHPSQKLELIDKIQRLGVSYHFESEIEEILEDIHTKHNNPSSFDAKDVHSISLCFRLLRQQGYNASPDDILKQLRDENGEFKKSVIEDVVGMLSLYEASHFRSHGEDILDQALHLTTYQLESRLSEMRPNLRQKVGHALKYPIRKSIPRLEARHYIGMYSQETSPNDPLLEFAILDFNVVQALHKQELNHATQWGKKLDFVTKVPYSRDRMVEAYFWSLCVYFEPQYSIGRKILCKLIAVITAVDDTYDAYGTLDELQLFTEAFQRWDASPLDPLPQCMKVVFQESFEYFNEIELLMAEEGKSCLVQYVKQAFQRAVEAYLIEAKWCNQGYIPTYKEYMENGMVTSVTLLLQSTSFLGLGSSATKHVFDWFFNDPKILKASEIICRLVDDMSSHKFERKRAHVASAVECLMNENGISEAEAYKRLNKDVENAWKDINEECLKPDDGVSKAVLECILNFMSTIELVYKDYTDKYTDARLLKDHIAALLVDPIGNDQNELVQNEQQPEIQQRLQHLKDQVGRLLLEKADHPSEKLKLIDNLQRLGVSYHFESEIEEILKDIHTKHKNPSCFDAKDVHTISLCFRLLRQQGYNASPDIFNQLRDENGEFKKSVIEDVVGMLSLYEASQFRSHGEDILDQALHLTTYQLESRLSEMSPNLRQKVGHALKYPIRKGIPRMEARHYIGMYSQETSPNDPLLEFAILDFNVLQALYKQELNHATQWWKKLDFVRKVPYSRDRMVEAYFWSLCVYFEPQYSIGRNILCKLIAILTAIDDTYDAYGTLEELQLFTEAFQRWDASPLDPLPECMKVVFEAWLEYYNEIELLAAEEEGKSCLVQYVKRAFERAVEAYWIEAKWCNQGYIPTYKEYMENAMVTSLTLLLQSASYLGLGNSATKHVFDWLFNDPKILKASEIICRLIGDMSSHKFERKRAHVASAVECLMNERGISEAEAYKHLNKDAENAWKDINEEWLKVDDGVPKAVLERIVNFVSTVELMYNDFTDRYTNAKLLRDHIAAVLVDSIGNDQNKVIT
ncbi:(-)-germacrene D synthase-like [Senna tora]|uniref:(-)-germacrene D synthase-like n=1 Tax=Senna tora TaxID=362788 RepID=A0A834WJ67_9FABA|nr:(-)-germacrene D synthase-like [Senna tora]